MSMRFFKKRRITDSLMTTAFSLDSGSINMYIKGTPVVQYERDANNNVVIKVPENHKFVFKVGDTESFTADQYGPSHATYAE